MSADATADGRQCSPACHHFEFPEILSATDDFDESRVIGSGGFGKVYKGTIYNGSTPVDAAIKRLDSSSNQGAPEFWAEVDMLSKLRHCHLVSLLGYCNHGKEMILAYEYMPNGTLGDHLHKHGAPLSWLQRLNICIGAARGLHYLHTGTGIEFGVIHRDVKSSNILLNENWAAKISDFGLSRIAPTNQTLTGVETLVKGTFGYFDPDYYCTGRLTRKSDVYAFGVVLLEVLCRKRAVDRSLDEEQWNLARWAQESIKEGNLKHIIDDDISGEISLKCLKQFVRIAEGCLHNNSKQRPTMTEVVVGLESILTLQEKMNSSMHSVGRTIFGRMLDMFNFPSNREKSVSAQSDSKPSRYTKPNIIQSFEEIKKFTRLNEFKFDDLERATSNFSEELMWRRGGYGRVYLGWVDRETFALSMLGSGTAVAVKRFDQLSDEQWMQEVDVLRWLAHPNIIRLLGYSSNKEHEHLLVYEYMQKGSLHHFLHEAEHNITETLSWATRLTIMIDVARGLAYLHSSKVIHHNVNSSAILLDQDFNAKLWDFRIARVCSEIKETHTTMRVMGTFGYWDPDFCQTGRVSVKSDIYSFGVLLLETLTSRRPIDYNRPRGHEALVTWAGLFIEEKCKLKKIMDPRLVDNYPLEGAFECTVLAQRCGALDPSDRPSSEEVLQLLEEIHAVHK